MVFFISLGFLQWRKVQADLIQNSVGFIFHFFPAWVALSVYEAYWGLDEKPFENTPDPRFLYRSGDIEDLYTRLLYTLSSRHGAALISGESGCGKTMMAPTWTARASCTGFTKSSSSCTVTAARPSSSSTRRSCSKSIFEEIRPLLNLQLDDAFLITLLLVGQLRAHPQTRAAGSAHRHARVPASFRRAGHVGLCRPSSAHGGTERAGVFARCTRACVRVLQRHPAQINNICDIALVIGFSRKLDNIDGDWMKRLIQAERGDGA